jgi:hypothetical protein
VRRSCALLGLAVLAAAPGPAVRGIDLDAVRRLLRANDVPITVPAGCGGREIWTFSHGLWLQFARAA